MKRIFLAFFLFLGASLFASEIYTKSVDEPFEKYYAELKKAIVDNHMNIIYEMDLMERFKQNGYDEKFGADFNKNGLDKVITLLVCNGYVGNQVSNIDPNMMALCPIRITIIKKGNQTTVSFVKSRNVSNDKRIAELLGTLDDVVINTIDLTIDKYMQRAFTVGGYELQHEGN